MKEHSQEEYPLIVSLFVMCGNVPIQTDKESTFICNMIVNRRLLILYYQRLSFMIISLKSFLVIPYGMKGLESEFIHAITGHGHFNMHGKKHVYILFDWK